MSTEERDDAATAALDELAHELNPSAVADGADPVDAIREATQPRVRGFCPMGCGETLFVGSGGHVTCSLIGCRDPAAVDTILADRETEHIVTFEAERFHAQHPLRERLNGELHHCPLHQWIAALEGPPVRPGRYRATRSGEAWSFTELPELACPAVHDSEEDSR